ncbi:MAG TPA: hypothetical protein VL882_15775 [Vicinamibacterales bacterium]|nr:hypothetical protein [Vicinamibacterales bacterium]
MLAQRTSVFALALVLVVPRAFDVEERRATGSLPAHVAAAFDEMAACTLSPPGDYVIFDRRAHAVYTIAKGDEAPKRIVQIGSETGRIIRPTAFNSAPDGSFVVADAPGNQQRVQFFTASGTTLGGFTMPGRGVPQITLGDLVLSGLGTLEYTGQTVLISQPELGSLVVEYLPTGTPLRTFGDLRETGQEKDPQVHHALNVGITLLNPRGGYYFVFLSGVPLFRKYDAAGKLVFERHIEGVELDPYVGKLPTTWPRRRGEIPIVPATVRTAAVDPDGNLWISLAAPYTYVYDPSGDKRRTFQFRGAGIISPTSFFFTRDRRVLVTPGCYAFDASR